MDCDHCGYERGTVDCCGRGDVEQLTRERDEARAERDEAEVEVERLRAVALLAADFVRHGTKAMSEVERLMRERDDARAEVERLRVVVDAVCHEVAVTLRAKDPARAGRRRS